jgi:hypothetical protein
VTLVRIASRVQYASANVATAIEKYFASLLSEDDQGGLSADTSRISEERLVGMVSAVLREARMAKRRGREFTELAQQVADPELKQAFLSPAGKVAIGDELIKRNSQDQAAGLDQWITEHFETRDDGYTIRDDRREQIEEFVQHVAEVERELENADF